ncbi:MAG: membrane protein insertion efficiency factor YidD [Candidatus Sumerlaeia bacterium]
MIDRILKAPLIVWHRWISPMLPPSCRFYPSCSVYAMQALDHYPLRQALPLILRRLSHCHPFHPGGYDPLPLDSSHGGEPNPNEKAGPR